MLKQQKISILIIAIVISTACQFLSPTTGTSTVVPDDTLISPTPVQPEPDTQASSQIELEQPVAIFDDLESEYGSDVMQWAQLAVEDFSASTGIQWSISTIDAGNSAASAQTKVNELVSDNNVLAIVGLSRAGQGITTMPIFDSAGVPVISLSGYAPLTQQGYTGLFRIAPDDEDQAILAGRFISEKLNADKVYLLSLPSANGPYFENLNSSFRQTVSDAGGEIVGIEEFSEDTNDYSGLSANIQAAGAEAVFMGTGSADQVVQLASALQGDVSIVAHYGAASSSLLDLDNVYVISRAPAIPADVVQRFLDQYGSYHLDGALAYEATMTALQAVQRAAENGNPDRASVLEELTQTNQPSELFSIPLAFEPNGELRDAQFYVLQVAGMTFKTVFP